MRKTRSNTGSKGQSKTKNVLEHDGVHSQQCPRGITNEFG